ncbi:YbaK/EbsC family protein [Chachezhania sediminis]|uniref:YbaK/EbsC family protein n=1 Tax=Chachezhania sediminis TaxID=2599291 RepID=UPI00131CA1BF|nr:YbaK/EbsC family protein [Chachezhania sediminis]
MSKSLKRVRAALETAGIDPDIRETALARTAADAAAALDCDVDQIAKSIIFAGKTSGQAILFLTAGAHKVDPEAAAALAGEPLGKADAALVRSQTGFAIGGVSPVGHLTQPRAFFDRRLTQYDVVWAAAGTPHHVFPAEPNKLAQIAGAELADFSVP